MNRLEHIRWTLENGMKCTVREQKELLAVAEAAAGVADAYRAWDDSLVAGPSPVRVTALLRDVLVASCEVQQAVAPLLEEAE